MPKVIIFPDVSSEHRWRVEADNNRITGSSGEGFRDRTDALRGFHDHVINVYGVLNGGQAVADEYINQIDAVFADEGVEVVYEGYTEDGEIDISYMPEGWTAETRDDPPGVSDSRIDKAADRELAAEEEV